MKIKRKNWLAIGIVVLIAVGIYGFNSDLDLKMSGSGGEGPDSPPGPLGCMDMEGICKTCCACFYQVGGHNEGDDEVFRRDCEEYISQPICDSAISAMYPIRVDTLSGNVNWKDVATCTEICDGADSVLIAYMGHSDPSQGIPFAKYVAKVCLENSCTDAFGQNFGCRTFKNRKSVSKYLKRISKELPKGTTLKIVAAQCFPTYEPQGDGLICLNEDGEVVLNSDIDGLRCSITATCEGPPITQHPPCGGECYFLDEGNDVQCEDSNGELISQTCCYSHLNGDGPIFFYQTDPSACTPVEPCGSACNSEGTRSVCRANGEVSVATCCSYRSWGQTKYRLIDGTECPS
jgi:hypothetical protein